MSKRGKRLDENMLENRIIVSLVIIAAIVVISIGYIWISNSIKNKTKIDGQIAKQNNPNESNASLEENKTDEDSESASSSIGKTVEDSQNANVEANNQDDNTANENLDSTSNTPNDNTTSTNNTVTNDEQTDNETNSNNSVQPSFIMPVDGEIMKGFSKENLVFSETLQEWITHQALDIKANSRDVVKCSADGTVKAIKSDPRYGLTVIVEHSAGFQTIYSNLLTAEFIVEGEQVKQGQTLGTIGSTAVFEIADESHLHFEMLLNSEYVDPSLYINN